MTANQNVVESCLLNQVLLNFIGIWGRSWSAFKGILFCPLESGLEGKCTIKTLHLVMLRIVVAWTQIFKSDRFNIKRIQDITSLSDVLVRLTKSALVSQLFLIEWREGFVVVMYVRTRFIGLLWSVKDLSLWEAEAPALLELCIFRLKDIFKCVIGSWRPNRFAHLLKSFTLGEANWNERIPHGVCRLFLTYEPEKLRSILNHVKWSFKCYSRVEFVFVKASSWHHLRWIRLVNRARVSFLEVSDTSTNFVIQLSICALWSITWQ